MLTPILSFGANQATPLTLQKKPTPLQFGFNPNNTGRPEQGRLAIVANRESHTLESAKDSDEMKIARSMGGVVTALMPILRQGDFWIASRPDNRTDTPFEDLRGEVERNHPHQIANLPEYTPVDVQLAKNDIKGHYNSVSNAQIWPLAHDRLDLTEPFSTPDWRKYVFVNRQFAKKILEKTAKQDWTWVHDYQLMLVPEMLRGERKEKNIAYFHHIPFSDMMKHFQARPELVKGLLGADLIGFHVPSSVQNFAQAVRREFPAKEVTINYDADGEGVTIFYQGRRIRVEAFPISIDAQALQERIETSDEIAAARQKWQNFKKENQIEYLGAGVERLDYSKGILQRVEAIDRFLNEHPQYIGRFSFVQIAAPTRKEVDAYNDFANEANEAIDRLNRDYSKIYRLHCKRIAEEGGTPPANANTWMPIKKEENGLPNDEVMGLFQVADFAVVNSTADGMNVVAKEFPIAQATRGAKGGVLIASSTMGATEQWAKHIDDWRQTASAKTQRNGEPMPSPEEFWVIPRDIQATADAIYKAIQMDPRDRKRAMEPLRQHIITHDVHQWTRNFLSEFQNAVRNRHQQPTSAMRFAARNPFNAQKSLETVA